MSSISLSACFSLAGRSKESMAGRMEQYACAGYLTAAIDCRYHGDRAVPEAMGHGRSKPQDPRLAYQASLVRCGSLHPSSN